MIEIQDTGSGIPPEVLNRIFDPFFTTKDIGDGTGLGLSICHAIVTELGGEITVQSEPGRGATLRVLLAPATPVAAVRAAPAAFPAAARSTRVMVIDDDVSVGATVKRVFARDHDVEVCVGGAEALARLALDQGFDAIICDVMMPDVSGMDVYGTLAATAPALARRMIFISGGAFTPRAREFFATTSQPCIEKPFDREELRRAVAAMTLPASAPT